jgi:hypothetical protein
MTRLDPACEAGGAESVRSKACSKLIDIVRLLAREAAREAIAKATVRASGGVQAINNTGGGINEQSI